MRTKFLLFTISSLLLTTSLSLTPTLAQAQGQALAHATAPSAPGKAPTGGAGAEADPIDRKDPTAFLILDTKIVGEQTKFLETGMGTTSKFVGYEQSYRVPLMDVFWKNLQERMGGEVWFTARAEQFKGGQVNSYFLITLPMQNDFYSGANRSVVEDSLLEELNAANSAGKLPSAIWFHNNPQKNNPEMLAEMQRLYPEVKILFDHDSIEQIANSKLLFRIMVDKVAPTFNPAWTLVDLTNEHIDVDKEIVPLLSAKSEKPISKFIIKPLNASKGHGVLFASSPEDLAQSLQKLNHIMRNARRQKYFPLGVDVVDPIDWYQNYQEDSFVLVEEFMSSSEKVVLTGERDGENLTFEPTTRLIYNKGQAAGELIGAYHKLPVKPLSATDTSGALDTASVVSSIHEDRVCGISVAAAAFARVNAQVAPVMDAIVRATASEDFVQKQSAWLWSKDWNFVSKGIQHFNHRNTADQFFSDPKYLDRMVELAQNPRTPRFIINHLIDLTPIFHNWNQSAEIKAKLKKMMNSIMQKDPRIFNAEIEKAWSNVAIYICGIQHYGPEVYAPKVREWGDFLLKGRKKFTFTGNFVFLDENYQRIQETLVKFKK